MLRIFDVTRTPAKRSLGLIAIIASGLVGAAAWAMTASTTADQVNPSGSPNVGQLSDSIVWPSADAQPPLTLDGVRVLPPAVLGMSGKLQAMYREGGSPGILKTPVAIGPAGKTPAVDFAIIVPRPVAESHKGRMGDYRVGQWPTVRQVSSGGAAYAPPKGLIEVTRDNADTPLSDHFRVRDFLTKDQQDVWPKYVAINLKLIDKLELVLADLKEHHGIDPSGVRVMSGFRTPQYNSGGGDPRGRASLSRHMYGDAADVFIDCDGDGRMDDLNKDGKIDIRDAQLILESVERVEKTHPALVGGAGAYKATSAHGPFIHIDTRGTRARW